MRLFSRTISASIVILSFLLPSVSAQLTSRPPSLVELLPKNNAFVEGEVLHLSTKQPIERAAVTVAGVRGETDAQGRFRVGPLPKGRWRLAVTWNGYLLAVPGGERSAGVALYTSTQGIYVTIDENQRVPLVLHLFSGGVISGTILNPAGVPQVGAQARALRPVYNEAGVLVFRNAGSVSADDRGEFRIAGLTPGEYVLEAAVPSLLLPSLQSPPNYSAVTPVYYPQATDPSKAQRVMLDVGRDVRLGPLILQPAEGRKVQVRAIDEFGQSMNSSSFVAGIAAVRKSGILGPQSSGLFREVSGLFTLGAGLYEVSGTAKSSMIEPAVSPHLSSAIAGFATVEVLDRDVEVEMIVRRGVGLAGRVSHPVAGIQIRFNSTDSDLLLPFKAISRADGSFALDGIVPGTYALEIPLRGRDDGAYITESDAYSFPEGKCLDSVRQGSRDLLKDGLVVSGENQEIVVNLRDESSLVRGTVSNVSGEKVSDAVVALVPSDRTDAGRYAATRTDQNGVFEFRCAAAGDFQVFAWSDLPGAAYRNEEFMKNYAGKGVSLHLEIETQVKDLTIPLLSR